MSISFNARKGYGWLALGVGLGFTSWRSGWSVPGISLGLVGVSALAKGVYILVTQVGLPLCRNSYDGLKDLKDRCVASLTINQLTTSLSSIWPGNPPPAPPAAAPSKPIRLHRLVPDDGSIFMLQSPKPGPSLERKPNTTYY